MKTKNIKSHLIPLIKGESYEVAGWFGAKAFTLVELIVVITILSILGTIALLSLQGYSRDARNSKRTSELGIIEKSLSLFYTTKGFYPNPNNPTTILYLGSTAWNQGTFGTNQNLQLESINELPIDPLTLTEYAYSTTSLKNEYQLGAVYEGLITRNNKINNDPEILNKTYAGNQDGVAKVIGDYNGSVLPVYSGSNSYILAIPTIINGDLSIKDLKTIIGNGKLVYNGGNTLPGNYSGTIFNTSKTNTYFTKTGTILVYSGVINQLKTDQPTRIQMLKNLQEAYSGTIFGQTNESITQILNTAIDTTTPNQQSKDLAIGILTNNLKLRQNQINNNGVIIQNNNNPNVIVSGCVLGISKFGECNF